jgi:hypothetical protein
MRIAGFFLGCEQARQRYIENPSRGGAPDIIVIRLSRGAVQLRAPDCRKTRDANRGFFVGLKKRSQRKSPLARAGFQCELCA